MNITELQKILDEAEIPTYGITVCENGVCTINFKPEATEQQRAQAQAIIDQAQLLKYQLMVSTGSTSIIKANGVHTAVVDVCVCNVIGDLPETVEVLINSVPQTVQLTNGKGKLEVTCDVPDSTIVVTLEDQEVTIYAI